MAHYDPLNLDYMDPYDVQVLTDSIFERIGNMIVNEISSDEYLNDNKHIPSSLAVYNYLKNIASSSSGISNIIPKTNVGTEIANINGTPIYNGVTEFNGEELTIEKLYKIKTNSKGQIISASEATAVDIQDLLSLSLSKPNASTISLNVNGSSVSTVTDSTGTASTVTRKTTTGSVIANIDGTDIYNGVTSSSGKGLISILTGVPGAIDTTIISVPAGATQYVWFIVGDGVVTGAVGSGSCTGGQSISISSVTNPGYMRYVCMFFG